MRRLLIIGCGGVALRMIPAARGRCRVFALSHSSQRCAEPSALGVTPLWGDLDRSQAREAVAGLAHDVMHFAPPNQSMRGARSAHLIAALAKGESLPQHPACISTGGDGGGRRV